MPCRGTLHVIAEKKDMARVQTWIAGTRNVMVHEFPMPERLKHVVGYILQAWLMMWADKYATPTAEYIMFMDTDAMFSLPVTCNSLFDSHGRIQYPHWGMGTAMHFKGPCEAFLGKECWKNFMAYFPFVMPRASFRQMREHITKHRGAASFNEAFGTWYDNNPATRMAFSQFVIMGNFMDQFLPDITNAISCNDFSDWMNGPCRSYIHPGFHYGWRQCRYLNACIAGDYQIYPGDGSVFQNKFSLQLLKYHEEVLTAGYCFKYRLQPGNELKTSEAAGAPGGCAPHWLTDVHPETVNYPRVQSASLNHEKLYARFRPDADQTHVCPTPILALPKNPVPETDALMA